MNSWGNSMPKLHPKDCSQLSDIVLNDLPFFKNLVIKTSVNMLWTWVAQIRGAIKSDFLCEKMSFYIS